jgi:hypothetical protein
MKPLQAIQPRERKLELEPEQRKFQKARIEVLTRDPRSDRSRSGFCSSARAQTYNESRFNNATRCGRSASFRAVNFRPTPRPGRRC